jgi:ribosomal protein S1
VDGMIHVSELSWSRIKHPSEILKVGDVVEVHVLSFDKEAGKFPWGIKKARTTRGKSSKQSTMWEMSLPARS